MGEELSGQSPEESKAAEEERDLMERITQTIQLFREGNEEERAAAALDLKKIGLEAEEKGDFYPAVFAYAEIGDTKKETEILIKAKDQIGEDTSHQFDDLLQFIEERLKELESPEERKEDPNLPKERPEDPLRENLGKTPVENEAEISKERLAAREEYVDAQIVYEKAKKNVGIINRIRKIFNSTAEIKGAAGEEEKVAEEKLREAEEKLKTVLGEYRSGEIKKLEEIQGEEEKKAELRQEILLETTLKEAVAIYELKTQKEIEKAELNALDRKMELAKEYGLKAVNWYRQLDWQQKMAVSGIFFVAGAGSLAIGGLLGMVVSGGAIAGRNITRILGGAGTAVGLEILMKSAQEKEAKKEVLELDGLKGALDEQNKEIDKKLFELIGRQKKEEKKRFLIAGAAGAVIGSGMLSKAIGEIIPDSWKEAVMEKFGFHQPEKLVSGAKLGQAPVIEQVEAPTAPEKTIEPAGNISAVAQEAFYGNEPGASFEIEAHKGDNLWKMTEQRLGFYKNFNELNPAQKTYVIDAIKDQIARDPEKFGLTDIDKIQIGQKIDFSQVLGDGSKVQDLVAEAKGLNEEQIKNILEYNQPLPEEMEVKNSELPIKEPETKMPSEIKEMPPLESKPEPVLESETAPSLVEPMESGTKIEPKIDAPKFQPEELKALLEGKTGEYDPEKLADKLDKLKIAPDNLPGKEQITSWEIQQNFKGTENLNMKEFEKVVLGSDSFQLAAETLKEDSRIISGYLFQLEKMDPNSPEAQAIKEAIRRTIEMDEKVYKNKNLFDPAIKKLLEK